LRAQKLNDDQREWLKKARKADHHNHLALGLSRRCFNSEFSTTPVQFPISYQGLPGMIDFIHSSISPAMNSGELVVKFLERGIQAAIEDNVCLLEASVDISLIKHFNFSPVDFLEEVTPVVAKYSSVFTPILGMNKTITDEVLHEWVPVCLESNLFVGVDLYGLELGQDISRFTSLYDLATRKNLLKKIHIGEFSDSTSIEEAVILFEPHELEHGINAVSSSSVLKMIKERNIRLNVCPESNLQLGAVKSLADHPIRTLFDYGIDITINTDDFLLFGKTISDQYIDLVENKVFSFQEIEGIREASMRAITF